jgi:Concanavalin A-like lectin/glucanases superfamily/PEP-CTERM motif
MKKFFTLAVLALATPMITQQSEALAFTLGPLSRDVIYSADGTFDRPNIFFNNRTDTIQISGQTVLGNESTYEAGIYFPSGIGASGLVFNEFKYALEDKVLGAGPNGLSGYNYPNFPNYALSGISSTTPLASDTWHHIAFVQGGGTQRLYLDGKIVGVRPGAGDIFDSDGGGFLGAIFRDDPSNIYDQFAGSFIGHLDTFRISNVARYSGNSFDAPKGDLTSDANTQLLYNFFLEDYFQQDGDTLVSDLSGNGRNGRFGKGFAGATSPSIVVPVDSQESTPVPEPTTVLGTLAFGAIAVRWRRKGKQQQKSVNSTVS